MKNYLTIQNEDLSETMVEEPESPYGFTYADYLTWNFKERIELIRGRIFKMSPASTFLHQRILIKIAAAFSAYLEHKNCECLIAPIDVRLKGKSFRKRKLKDDEITTVVQPDIIVVCDEEKLKDNRSVDGAPELVVEILSPGNTKAEVSHKFDLYEENGVLEYWIVYPDQQEVQVYLLNNHEKFDEPIIYGLNDVVPSKTIPGFSIAINQIFNFNQPQ